MFEGLVAGIVSGTIVAIAQHYVLWLKQQHFQMKKSVFDDAVSALAMYEADAMNIELQSSSGIGHLTKLRDPTNLQMTKALALVQAFFTPEAANAYKSAYGANLSPKNVPNSVFYERRDVAVRLLAIELAPHPQSIFAPLFRNGRQPKPAVP